MWTIDGKSYARRKLITVSNTRVASTLTDYPLPVWIAADADIGAYALATGSDLRFTLTNGTLLSAEKDNFAVSGTATGLFHVKIPSLLSTAPTQLYCYYGNPTQTAQATPSAVWDASHVGVWHLSEATGQNAIDSTGNTLTGTKVNDPVQGAGQIGGSCAFGGTNYFDLGTASRSILTGASGFAFQCWIKTTATARQFLIGAYKVSNPLWGISINDSAASNVVHKLNMWLRAYPAGVLEFNVQTTSAPAADWNDGNWHHLAFSTGMTLATSCILVDGVSCALSAAYNQSPALTNFPVNTGLGALITDSTPLLQFVGSMDEARLSKTNRGAAWMAASYWLQKDTSQLTWGAEDVAGPRFSQQLEWVASARIPQGVAKRVVLKAYLAVDHTTVATGKTIPVVISKNAAAFGNPGAGATNATEIANGYYYVDLGVDDTATVGPLIVRGTETTIDPTEKVFEVVAAADVLPANATQIGGQTATASAPVTVNQNLGTTQPINFEGTSTRARVKTADQSLLSH